MRLFFLGYLEVIGEKNMVFNSMEMKILRKCDYVVGW